MLRDRSVNKLLAMLTSSLERGIMFEKKGYFGYVCFLFFITVFEIISILFWFSLKILFLFEFSVLYVFYIFFRTKKGEADMLRLFDSCFLKLLLIIIERIILIGK